jgi:hypothetical protein
MVEKVRGLHVTAQKKPYMKSPNLLEKRRMRICPTDPHDISTKPVTVLTHESVRPTGFQNINV